MRNFHVPFQDRRHDSSLVRNLREVMPVRIKMPSSDEQIA